MARRGRDRAERLVRLDPQVAEGPAGRILGGLLQEPVRAAAAQPGQHDPARPVLVHHLAGVQDVGPAVVDAVREQQQGGREPVAADVRALPYRRPFPPGQRRRHQPAPARAALVVAPVRAHRDHGLGRRRTRLAVHRGQVLVRAGRFAPADRLMPGGAVHPGPPPAQPAVQPGPAGTADGDQPEAFGRGALLDLDPQGPVQHRRTAERVRAPRAGDLEQQPAPAVGRGARHGLARF